MTSWMRTVALALALLLVACGGDELGLDDSDLEADAAVPVDAGKDAGKLVVQDDGQVDAAVVDGSSPGPELIDGPATCMGGATSGGGAYGRTQCLTSTELGGGCIVVQRARNGATELVSVARSVLEHATYQLFHKGEILLCTGSPPTTDWLCGNVLLGACTNNADQSTCQLRYILEPMPTQVVACP